MVQLLLLTLLAASSAAAADLDGRVVERRGGDRSPLAKALVTVRGDGRDILAAVRSDREGRFFFSGLPSARLRVAAERPGFIAAEGEAYRTLDCSVPCGPVEIELSRGAVVTGEVVDDLGEPVANVRILLGQPDAADWFGSDRTDDLGRYRLAGLQPGDYQVRAIVADFSKEAEVLEADPIDVRLGPAEQTRADFVLRRIRRELYSISGVVTGVELDEQRRPRLQLNSRDAGRGRRRGPSYQAPLGPDGRFALDGVSAGAYSFSVDGAGRPSIPVGEAEISGEMRGLTLRPQPLAIIEGVALLRGSAQPNRELALVLIQADGGRRTLVAPEAPAGEFRRRLQQAGEYRIQPNLRNWSIDELRVDGTVVEGESFEIEQGRTTRLEVWLTSEAAVLSGVVRTPAGEPAANYLLGLRSDAGLRTAQTDQNGRFVFGDVAAGDYRLAAWPAATEADLRRDSFWQAAGGAVREFAVEPGAEVELAITAAQ